jgi:hypothetical protein
MKTVSKAGALSSALVVALGLALAGCGGGGGGGGSSSVAASSSLGGTAAAGIFKNADVKVYDATTLDMTKIATAATLVPATTTDGNGAYHVTLPAGFSHPVYLMVTAKADGSSTMRDEVLGTAGADIPVPAGALSMCSVVPAVSAGVTLTGHVTPFTNLMCKIVANKIGKSDVNAAINLAANTVNQVIGVDPLNSDPVNDPAMVARLAAVSNIARPGSASDPDDCADKPTNAEKIACTIGTLAGAITPMPADYVTSSATPVALPLVMGPKAALQSGLNALVLADVAAHSGAVSVADLTGKPQEAAGILAALPANVTPNGSANLDGIAQAKQFFANLRTGILPYTNNSGTGFLDDEGNKMATEFNQLTSSPYKGLDELAHIASWAMDLHAGTLPAQCSGNTASATCSHTNNNGFLLSVTLTNSGSAWSYGVGAGAATGTIVFDASGNQITMDGYIPPMTSGAGVAKVGNPGGTDANATSLTLTKTAIAGQDMWEYTFNGTVKDLKCTGNGVATCTTPVFKLALEAGTKLDINQPASGNGDPAKSYANFSGKFITANYSFIGQIEVKNLQAKSVSHGVAPNTWTSQDVVGGTASFTGTINGTGLTSVDINHNNDFNLMVGKLEASVDDSNYDPSLVDSATNFEKFTLTFTGTVFKSVADPGLKLLAKVNDTGWDSGTLIVSYNDYNKGISITGATNFDHHNDAVNQDLTLSDGNGISLVLTTDSKTNIMKGNVKLGEIKKGKITYTDGTFESLM